MASIVWNEKGKYWRCQVTSNGVTKNFKSYTVGNAGKREVQTKVRKFVSNGSYKDVYFSQEWSLFLEDVKARSSISNFRNLEQIGRLYILPVLGKRRMLTIRITDLQRLINSSTKQDGSPLSAKSLSNIKNALSSFFHYARLDNVTDLETKDLYTPKNAVKGSKNVLNTEQIKRLFTDFESEFYANYWKLLVCTGMRPGEALGLKWTDVNGFHLIIQRSINVHNEITECKNKNARRAIPINSLIEEILKDQKQRTEYLASEWIFPNTSGGMSSQSTTQNSIKRISSALGVDICAYSLRHTFVSLMASAAIPEAYIKNIVGHSTAMPTYSGTYAHELTGDQEKASAMIDDTLRRIL